jgi:hypothetical protein
MTEFLNQSKVIDGKMLMIKGVDLKFISTTSASNPDFKGNSLRPERGIVRFQFMEYIVRLSEEKFQLSGVVPKD